MNNNRYLPKYVPIPTKITSKKYRRRDGEHIFLIAYKMTGDPVNYRKVMRANKLSDVTDLPWELEYPSA